jgi:hypothetical protein
VTNYKVFTDDNFHYQDKSERVTHGLFDTAADAVAACKSIVDEFLAGAFREGMSGEALYDLYVGFGEDPFVVTVDPQGAPVGFSASAYAKEQSGIIAGYGRL